MDKRPFLIMRKIFYIFLIHVLVFGSLWIWRYYHDGENFSEVINLEDGIQVYLGISTPGHSSPLEIEVCIDEEKISRARIQDSLPGFFLLKPDVLSSGFEDAKHGLSCYTMQTDDKEHLLIDNQ
ncbi:MAG: hypothetical protein ABR542_08085 [Desulfonatronovibrio sp.]|nr:hypothetical protein [Desulfovibrionales bacterium]